MDKNISPTPASDSETPHGAGLTGETPNNTSGSGETPETTTTTAALTADDARKEIERLTASLKRANAEAKQHREQATELQKFKEQVENARLSEKERLEKLLATQQKEHADALLKTQERVLSAEVRAQAGRLGFVDPSDALAMLNRAQLEYDDDGVPANAEALLKDLLKAKPYLAGGKAATQATPTSGGATNPPRSQSSDGGGEITAQYVADVLQGKINWQSLTQERRSAVLAWQAKHPFRF